MQKILIGVDEAGRGPLAGPVAVGIVAVPMGFNVKKSFPGVGDSKALSEKKREELYAAAAEFKRAGTIEFCVRFASAAVIDRKGIVHAVKRSVWSGVQSLAPETDAAHVLLDGLLSAPPEYSQETIIRGDATEPVISLASVIAKVSRDRLMCRLAKEYPEYGFETHKGYGTKQHRDIIARIGLSEVHRQTYCHL